MHKPTVLIIGKAGHLQEGLEARLRIAGCRVSVATDGRTGVARAIEAEPDLVLLDWDLSDADALDVCREIRRRLQPRRLPVFLLTPEHQPGAGNPVAFGGSTLPEQQWNYFEYGFGALLAWLETASGTNDRIVSQGLELDQRRLSTTVDGRDIGLTTTEFRLLWVLAGEPGRVFQRRELAEACGSAGRTRERTVDVHVKSVRDKLGDRAYLLETVQRVGYRFREWNEHGPTLSSRPGELTHDDRMTMHACPRS